MCIERPLHLNLICLLTFFFMISSHLKVNLLLTPKGEINQLVGNNEQKSLKVELGVITILIMFLYKYVHICDLKNYFNCF